MTPRAVAAFAALAVLVLAWSLLAHRQGFAAHMALHLAVIAVAAPLLAAALAHSRFDPVARWPGAFNPMLASLVELAVVWGWHVPALHHAAHHHVHWMALQQALFLAAGLAVWLAAFSGGAARSPGRIAAGIGGLLLTSMHMTLLGALLAVSGRPLYGPASSVAEQHLGGILMLGIGGTAYLAGALILIARLLGKEDAP